MHGSFVMGKARLAPIYEITIQPLELTAAVISVKQSQNIRKELETKIDQVNYWTDSITLLKCITQTRSAFACLIQTALLSTGAHFFQSGDMFVETTILRRMVDS